MHGQKMPLNKTGINFKTAGDDKILGIGVGEVKINLAQANAASFTFKDSVSSAEPTSQQDVFIPRVIKKVQTKKKHKLHVPNPIFQIKTPASPASLYCTRGFSSTRSLALKKSVHSNVGPHQSFG